MFLNGFKPEGVASSMNPRPFHSMPKGYQRAINRGMQDYLRNSVIAATTATLIAVLLAFPAAYALSLRREKAVEGSLSFFLSTRFMPVAAVTLPLCMYLKHIGGLDNIWVLATSTRRSTCASPSG
jgi:sorbitol/mannitol transport system permease protein